MSVFIFILNSIHKFYFLILLPDYKFHIRQGRLFAQQVPFANNFNSVLRFYFLLAFEGVYCDFGVLHDVSSHFGDFYGAYGC